MGSYNHCKPGSCHDVIAEAWKNLALSPGDMVGHLQLLTFQNHLRKEYESRFSSENCLLTSSSEISIHCGMGVSSLEKNLGGSSGTLKKFFFFEKLHHRVLLVAQGMILLEKVWIEDFELKWFRRVALWMWRTFRNTVTNLLIYCGYILLIMYV